MVAVRRRGLARGVHRRALRDRRLRRRRRRRASIRRLAGIHRRRERRRRRRRTPPPAARVDGAATRSHRARGDDVHGRVPGRAAQAASPAPRAAHRPPHARGGARADAIVQVRRPGPAPGRRHRRAARDAGASHDVGSRVLDARVGAAPLPPQWREKCVRALRDGLVRVMGGAGAGALVGVLLTDRHVAAIANADPRAGRSATVAASSTPSSYSSPAGGDRRAIGTARGGGARGHGDVPVTTRGWTRTTSSPCATRFDPARVSDPTKRASRPCACQTTTPTGSRSRTSRTCARATAKWVGPHLRTNPEVAGSIPVTSLRTTRAGCAWFWCPRLATRSRRRRRRERGSRRRCGGKGSWTA